MKHATLTAIVTLLLAGHASAADIYAPQSLKDGPVPATWTGFYVDAGIGGHFVDHALSSPYGIAFDGIAAQGVAGRFGAGFDWQPCSRCVIGLFGDYQLSDASTTLTLGTASASVDTNYLWTFGGRAGWLATQSTLIYGLAGFTEGQFEGKGFAAPIGKITSSGWTVGGGVEQQLGGGFSLKGEYRYNNLEPHSFAGGAISVDSDVQGVFASVAYKLPVGRGLFN